MEKLFEFLHQNSRLEKLRLIMDHPKYFRKPMALQSADCFVSMNGANQGNIELDILNSVLTEILMVAEEKDVYFLQINALNICQVPYGNDEYDSDLRDYTFLTKEKADQIFNRFPNLKTTTISLEYNGGDIECSGVVISFLQHFARSEEGIRRLKIILKSNVQDQFGFIPDNRIDDLGRVLVDVKGSLGIVGEFLVDLEILRKQENVDRNGFAMRNRVFARFLNGSAECTVKLKD